MDPTAVLLASDYLYTSAFSSLRSVPDTSPNGCFEIPTVILETIMETFVRICTSPKLTDNDQTMFSINRRGVSAKVV